MMTSLMMLCGLIRRCVGYDGDFECAPVTALLLEHGQSKKGRALLKIRYFAIVFLLLCFVSRLCLFPIQKTKGIKHHPPLSDSDRGGLVLDTFGIKLVNKEHGSGRPDEGPVWRRGPDTI